MQLNRMSKIAIGVAAACAIYSAGGFWGVPALMKWAAEGPVTEALGRKVSIEKAEFNPWTLEATIHNIAMADQSGSNPALSIGRFYANTAFLESIKRFGVVLQELSVNEFNGSVQISEQGGTSFDDIIARLSAADTEKAPSEPAGKKQKPFPFCINNIELTNSGFHVSAPSMGIDEKITDLELAVPFIGTIGADVERHVTPKLSLKDNGSPFTADGTSLPFQDSVATKLHADIKGYDLAHLAGMIPVPLDLKVNKGTISLSADLIFALATQDKPATILLSAKASADDVDANMQGAAAENNKISFAKLAVDLGELDLVKQSATVENITLTAPNIALERLANGDIAWSGVVKPAPQDKSKAEPAKTPEEPAKAADESAKAPAEPAKTSASQGEKSAESSEDFTWVVKKIEVANGTVQLLDRAANNTRIKAQDLNATVGNLTLKAGEETAFTLNTKTLEGALELDGKISISDLKLASAVTADKLNLASVAAYAKAAGADVAGALSTKLDVAVDAKADLDATVKGSVSLASLSVALPESGIESKASELAVGGIDLVWKGKDKALTLNNESLRLLGASAKLSGELPIDAQIGSLSVKDGKVALKDTVSVALKSADIGKASVSLPVNAATVTVLTDKANATGVEWVDGASGHTRLASSVAEKIAFEIAGQKSQFGAIDSVSVSKLDAPAQGTMSLESVKIDKPRYRVSKLSDGSLDIDSLLGKRESAEKAKQVREQVQASVHKVEEKTGRESERPIRVNELSVTNGYLGFTDKSINPPGEIRCSEVTVSVKPLVIGGENTPATLQTSALINGVSKISLTGQGSPLADKGKLTAKGSLTAVSMPFFSPYTLFYTSYPIKRGNLTVNADVTIVDKSKLKVDNRITIERLEWGDYSPNATSSAIPVTLASALLTDSKGNVDFGLPISGDLADPSFSIGEVVLIALKNLILKVVASPVNLLTSLASFGTGAGASNAVMIPFVSGLASMGEEEKKIAKPIVDALKKNPKSKLEIVPVVASSSDDQEVHRRTYDGMLKIAMSTLPADQRTREAAVNKVFKMILPKENQSLSTQDKEQKLYAAVKPDLNSLINVANARAKMFSRLLVENGIEESRIFIAGYELDKKGAMGGIKVSLLK